MVKSAGLFGSAIRGDIPRSCAGFHPAAEDDRGDFEGAVDDLSQGDQRSASPSQFSRLRFQGGNLLFQPLHFARFIVLLLRTGQLLLERLQLLLDDFQAFLVAAVH